LLRSPPLRFIAGLDVFCFPGGRVAALCFFPVVRFQLVPIKLRVVDVFFEELNTFLTFSPSHKFRGSSTSFLGCSTLAGEFLL